MEEFAQVSIVRYNALLESRHLLEIRILELEDHINALEKLLTENLDDRFSFVTVDKDAIREVVEGAKADEV